MPRVLSMVLAALALLGGTARADEVPEEHQALVFLRVLGYDRALKSRPHGPVVVALLHRSGQAESEAAVARMRKALAKVAGKPLAGRPIQVVSIRYDRAQLEESLAAAAPAAVFVCDGLRSELLAIRSITRRLGILSWTAREADVREGLSVAVAYRAGKATIVVNLTATRAEGRKLDPRVLELAEVIR